MFQGLDGNCPFSELGDEAQRMGWNDYLVRSLTTMTHVVEIWR